RTKFGEGRSLLRPDQIARSNTRIQLQQSRLQAIAGRMGAIGGRNYAIGKYRCLRLSKARYLRSPRYGSVTSTLSLVAETLDAAAFIPVCNGQLWQQVQISLDQRFLFCTGPALHLFFSVEG